MRFKNWAENHWDDTTVTHVPQDQLDPGTTGSWQPGKTTDKNHGDPTVDSRYSSVPNDATLAKVAQALEPLMFDGIETGFSGTPDYAAPEQFFSIGQRQPDFYQHFLKEIEEIFPNMSDEIREMLDNWLLFRQEVLRRLGKRNYMGSGQGRPIQYSLPLMTIGRATPAFEEVKKILDQDQDPELANIKKLFYPLYVQHNQLAQKIQSPLARMLQAARNNPASYDPNVKPEPQQDINPNRKTA